MEVIFLHNDTGGAVSLQDFDEFAIELTVLYHALTLDLGDFPSLNLT